MQRRPESVLQHQGEGEKCTDGEKRVSAAKTQGWQAQGLWIPRACLAQGSLECFASEPPGRGF